ncbi:MAG: glycosyltransferase [Sedimentisphaerales bacterium]|nr:glycosyltransferase [Sedimentisphaerales bacterium]
MLTDGHAEPKVSIVLPTYNDLRFLPGAIESVLGQSFQDFELVVVNDGSTDGTKAYLDGLNDPRVRVIHQENRRLPEALNAGFRAARGDLLTWTSADNYCAPGFLEHLVGALEAYPEAGFAYSDFANIDKDGQIISVRENPSLTYHDLLAGNPGVASFMYRRACQDKVGYYDPSMECAEDWDYWLRILEHFETVYVPQVLYHYRRHEDGMSQRLPERVYRASRRVFDKAMERRNREVDLRELYPAIRLCRCEELAMSHAGLDFGGRLLQSRFADPAVAVRVLEQVRGRESRMVHVTSNLAVAYARLGQWDHVLPLLREMMGHTEDGRVLDVCRAIIAAQRADDPQLLAEVTLFRPDRKGSELFQSEAQKRRVFRPSERPPVAARGQNAGLVSQDLRIEKAEQCRARSGNLAEEGSVKELTRGSLVDIARKGGTDKCASGHDDTPCHSKCSMPLRDESSKALKIAVLPHRNNLSFMGEILARMRATHEVRIVDCNDQEGIAEALLSADACWIEWATDFAVRVTALPRRCKTILRLHSFEAFCSSVQQIHWENVDDLVLVSPYIRDVLKDRVPDIESKVRTHVVPNCIDLDKFRFQDRPRGKQVAFVGALRPAKNIPLLMQCFREIHAADPEYTLHVAGELFGQELHRNELYYYIKHMEKELGIQGSVRFYGHVQDISTWLDDKDFILSASIREGHPVNIAEGMAKGLKPVVHNYPGARAAYPDEWIFGTAQECRDIVLASHFDRREYRAYVAQRWSTEKVLPQIDALLQGSPDASLFGGSPRTAPLAERPARGAASHVLAATPKVSIVTACYNAERFLAECLDSILKQTMAEWELFLIDDGSTDGTRGMIEEYARRDARIKPYYFDDNRGPYVRRNFAIERANAPFIVIHDADDIMCEEKLQRLHAAISANERLGVVGSFYRMFLDNFEGIEHCEDVTLATSQEEILEAYRNFGACDFCPHGAAIIRKRLFEEIGAYDENPFGSDSFWLAKVAEYACRSDEIALKNVPEFLMLRRMHAASQTATLPTFDSRSRRARFVAHWRGQLAAAMRGLRSDSPAELKAQLRRCVCGDFVERNAQVFAQWESEPLTDQMVDGFLARISAQFARGQYVRCIVTCGIVERLVDGIARTMPRYDLMRGLAYFALALPDRGRMYLEREWQAHGTPAARDFLRTHLQGDKALRRTRADRVEIIRAAISRDGQEGPATAPDRSAQVGRPLLPQGVQLEEHRRHVLDDLEAKYRRMPDDSPAKRLVALRLSELLRRVGLAERSRRLALEASAVRNDCDGESCNSRSDASAPGLAVSAAREERPGADAPSVTVVTVCRNGERFLPECLDSLLNQTLPTWELFLLDDGSTDGTRRIMEEYAGRDARIKPHFFDDNRGPYVRRNFAIERANAPFIVIQDGDDLMSPVKLETLYNEICRDDSLAMVGSFYRTFLERFTGLERTDPIELPLAHEEIAERLSTWRHGVSHISGIIRKSMFERIGPYDENPFASDSFWSAKLAEYARHCPDVRFKNVPAYLTLYRVHGTSQTQVLSTVDPRNRRVRFRQYCECKLREIREKAAMRPTLDVAAKLRACDCSDFLTRFKAQIIKWESEPVSPEVTRHLLETVAALFNNRCYVSCVSFLNGIEAMDRGIARRFRNFDLLKAMALWALDARESSLSCLHREMENHDNPAAREFLRDFFEKGQAQDVQAWCAERAGQFRLEIGETRCSGSESLCSPAVASQKLGRRL